MRRIVLALAGAAALAFAPAAQAQTGEQLALATEVTQRMFDAIDVEGLIVKAIEDDADGFLGEMPARPEWNRYLKDALREEALHDQPAFEALLARAVAKELTVEELQAGVELLNDRSMRAALTSLAAGGAAPGEPSAAARRIAGSRAGRAFLGKMAQFDKIMEAVEVDLMAEILPGTFRRFADKVEAGERARKAGSSPP